MSYKFSWAIIGFIFRRRERLWPIPPAAPRTATCVVCG
jgi:hypothetical protein